MNQLFLPEHQEQADKEQQCYDYLLVEGIALYMESDFEKAAAYHENIARSLRELGRMKKEKEKLLNDRAWFLLKQMDSDRQQKELLYKIQVNIYE